MKKTGLRLKEDIDQFHNNDFVELCRLEPQFFTRNRKMPLYDLLLCQLSKRGTSVAMELRRFQVEAKKDTSVSDPAYLKQRMKLNPAAFVYINDFHLTNFYKEVDYLHKVNGYLILAVDGSNLNIPTTPENIEHYGNASRKGMKPRAALGLSCLTDVTNKVILDCTINRCKFKEFEQVETHLEKLPKLLGNHKYLVTADRGYPSLPFFIRMCDKNHKFLVRLRKSDYKKEKKQMKTADEEVTIQVTKDRLKVYKGTETEKFLKEKKSLTLRFVKIELETGEVEYLATNLGKEEFSTEDIGKLYPMRW